MRFVSRAVWGARTSSLTTLQAFKVAIHWEGPRMGVFPHTSCAGYVRGIQNYHMDTQGWSDIAYNLIVCPHGYVFEGRGVGRRSAANGGTDSNSDAYAICYLSGEGDAFTDEAKGAINEAALLLVPAGPIWKRHRDYTSTACPGDEISAWVAAGHPSSVTPVPTPKEPPVAVRYSLPTGQVYVTDFVYRRYVGPLTNDVLNDTGIPFIKPDAAHVQAFHDGLIDAMDRVSRVDAANLAISIVQNVVAALPAGSVSSESLADVVAAEFAKRLALTP